MKNSNQLEPNESSTQELSKEWFDTQTTVIEPHWKTLMLYSFSNNWFDR